MYISNVLVVKMGKFQDIEHSPKLSAVTLKYLYQSKQTYVGQFLIILINEYASMHTHKHQVQVSRVWGALDVFGCSGHR